MAYTEEELNEIIKEPNADIEKFTTLSYDGSNLLTRIPKQIVSFIRMKRGNKIRWLVGSEDKQIKLEVIK